MLGEFQIDFQQAALSVPEEGSKDSCVEVCKGLYPMAVEYTPTGTHPHVSLQER